ncbi:hypothetical protein V8D89_006951 [Ganoderma adspersum]
MPVDYYGDFHHRTFIIDPVIGCTSSASTPTFLSNIGQRYLLSPEVLPFSFALLGTIFIRGGQTIADIVLIGVTWKATYEDRREGSMTSLMRIMFKNGTSYFIITAILVSHFMLDLHEAHQALSHRGSGFTTLQIMSVDIGHPYSDDARPEELEERSVDSNSILTSTEPDSSSETGRWVTASTKCPGTDESQSPHDTLYGQELRRSPSSSMDGHPEIV